MTKNRKIGTRSFDPVSWLPTSLLDVWANTTRDWEPIYTPAERFGPKSQILPKLWVGNELAAQALWRRSDWTVIDVREADTEHNPPTVVAIPLLRQDTKGLAGRKALTEIADAIDAALKRGDNCLVHCWMGKERSPLSVVGWLVMRQGYSLSEAYDLLKRKRGAWDRRGWLTKGARKALNLAPRPEMGFAA